MARTPFGGKGRDTGSEPVYTPPAAASGSTSPGGLTAFIDQGSEFEGKLSFRDTVRIDGRFSGEISSENTLIVGESGEIQATIRSNVIAISGSVNGEVRAARKVVLHKTARVEGTVETPSIVIEEGAVLNGELRMSGGDAKQPLKAVPGGHAPPMSEKTGPDRPKG